MCALGIAVLITMQKLKINFMRYRCTGAAIAIVVSWQSMPGQCHQHEHLFVSTCCGLLGSSWWFVAFKDKKLATCS